MKKRSETTAFSDEMKSFIKSNSWIFAKTYAQTWPHEYIVQEQVNSSLFLELANHIDSFGHEKYFYKKKMTYFDYDGHTAGTVNKYGILIGL